MNQDVFNLDIRTFLKEVGVSSHEAISRAVNDALAQGKLKGTETLKARMTLTVDGIDLTKTIEGSLALE